LLFRCSWGDRIKYLARYRRGVFDVPYVSSELDLRWSHESDPQPDHGRAGRRNPTVAFYEVFSKNVDLRGFYLPWPIALGTPAAVLLIIATASSQAFGVYWCWSPRWSSGAEEKSMYEEMAVTCKHVVKAFDSGENRVLALRGIDLDVHFGEMTLLVGPVAMGRPL
jgi:hypothetical protein